MPTEQAPKNALVTAFDAYKETEEAKDMISLIPVSKPSAILFMAFSAGWGARRDGAVHADSFEAAETEHVPVRGPDCACCEQQPRKDCTVPGCAMKDVEWALPARHAGSLQCLRCGTVDAFAPALNRETK